MSENIQIELTHPALIDADPSEVGHLATAEFAAALTVLHGLMPDVVTQARSSHASLLLDLNPALTAEELSEAWLDAPVHSQLVRAAGLMARAGEMLREATEAL